MAEKNIMELTLDDFGVEKQTKLLETKDKNTPKLLEQHKLRDFKLH